MSIQNRDRIDYLRGKLREPDQWKSAWEEVKEILKTDAESIVESLSGLINELIDNNTQSALKICIIISLEESTKRQPGIVPVELLVRLLSEDKVPDYLSILCTASMLVRINPELIISKGFQNVLRSTEIAHRQNNDPTLRYLDRKAKSVAIDIWNCVADGDPASLVVLLEYYIKEFGWQQHTTHLLATKILEAAPRHIDIIYDSIELFKKEEEQHNNIETQWKSPGDYIQGLLEIQIKHNRKNDAEVIAKEIFLDGIVSISAPIDTISFKPDPAVDKLIEDLLSDDQEVESQARERLRYKLKEPSFSLVKGVCEVAYEMFKLDIRDDRYAGMLATIYFATKRDPRLVPVEDLQNWCTDINLPDDTRVLIYAILAQACPGWIIDQCFSQSFSLAVGNGDTFSSPFLSALGIAFPVPIIEFGSKWFDRKGYTQGQDDMIVDALEAIAAQHPEHFKRIVGLFTLINDEKELPDATEEEDGMFEIDLNFNSIGRRIEKMKKIKNNHHGS